jgi:hypothetical protein
MAGSKSKLRPAAPIGHLCGRAIPAVYWLMAESRTKPFDGFSTGCRRAFHHRMVCDSCGFIAWNPKVVVGPVCK